MCTSAIKPFSIFGRNKMRKLLTAIAIAVTIVPSAAVFAQASQQPVTREQVRAELAELERAGYNPSAGDDSHYPDQLLAAEAKVAAEHAAAGTALGGVSQGTTEAGVTNSK
jgi:hypothetical protein